MLVFVCVSSYISSSNGNLKVIYDIFLEQQFYLKIENLSLDFQNIMMREYRKENLAGCWTRYVMSSFLNLAQLSENDISNTTTCHSLRQLGNLIFQKWPQWYFCLICSFRDLPLSHQQVESTFLSLSPGRTLWLS